VDDRVDWQDSSTLRWVGRPEQVREALGRGESFAGVALIALALNHADPEAVLPLIATALESQDLELRRQAVIALAHVARLHHTVDRRCLDLLRACPRGNEADDDLWSFVAHRELPFWLWRHHLGERLTWLLGGRWRR